MNSSRHSRKKSDSFEPKKQETNTAIDPTPRKQYKSYGGRSNSRNNDRNQGQENNKKIQIQRRLNQTTKIDEENWMKKDQKVKLYVKNIIQNKRVQEKKVSQKYTKKARKEDTKKREAEIKKKVEEAEAKIYCPICLDRLFSNEKTEGKTPFAFEICDDVFHKGCLRNYLKEEIAIKAFPIECPKCGEEISDTDIKDTIKGQSELLTKYEDFALDFVLSSNKDYLRCLTPDCTYAFCMNLEDEAQMTCPLCSNTYCMMCKVDWHQGMTCKQREIKRKQEIKKLKGRGEKMTDEGFTKFANKSGYKKCPYCGQFNEKIDGCNAVTCLICRTAFCFGCGRDAEVCNCNNGY